MSAGRGATGAHREMLRRRVYAATGQQVISGYLTKLIESGEGDHVYRNAVAQQGRGQQQARTAGPPFP